MDQRTATITTTAKISEFNEDFCDVRCPHLYGMFDRCGLYGRITHEFKLHLFRRADGCKVDFPEKQTNEDNDNNREGRDRWTAKTQQKGGVTEDVQQE